MKNSIAAAKLLNHAKGVNLGARGITISTAGIVSKIKKYTYENHPYRLAVSLNGIQSKIKIRDIPNNEEPNFYELLVQLKDTTLTA